jgi:hypothetical protein
MPARPNVPQVLQWVDTITDFGADLRTINKRFISYSGTAPTVAELSVLAATALTAWASDMAPLYDANKGIENVEFTDLSSATSAVGQAAAQHIGTRTGGALAAGTATVLSKHIARRYRGGHPREYLQTGVTTDLVTVNEWASAYVTAVGTGWTNYTSAVLGAPWSGGGTLTLVNVSYYTGFTNHTFPSGRVRPVPNLRATPVVDTVLNTLVNPKVASQRRRNLQSV